MDPNEERQMWPDGDAPDKQKMDQASPPSQASAAARSIANRECRRSGHDASQSWAPQLRSQPTMQTSQTHRPHPRR